MSRIAQSRSFEVTGRFVLVCILGFFGVVFAINGIMVWAAKSTFGGLETASSYKAGLQFKSDIAAAQQQSAMGWQVTGTIVRNSGGDAVLDVSVRDRAGTPLSGLVAAARLAHPADARLDHDIELRPVGGGAFRGASTAAAGQWELVIDMFRGDDRIFRSRSRVILK